MSSLCYLDPQYCNLCLFLQLFTTKYLHDDQPSRSLQAYNAEHEHLEKEMNSEIEILGCSNSACLCLKI